MLEISLENNFYMRKGFPSGNLALNVCYFFHILLIFMWQLKCHEKQDKLTYNFGYLSFIGESLSPEVKINRWLL